MKKHNDEARTLDEMSPEVQAAEAAEAAKAAEAEEKGIVRLDIINALSVESLRKDTLAIIEEYRKTDKSQRAVAKLLWHIEHSGSFKEAGYKSLDAYAAAINLPDKSAHRMAQGGRILQWAEDEAAKAQKEADDLLDRYFESHSPVDQKNAHIAKSKANKLSAFADSLGWTKASRLVNADVSDLTAAIISGEVKPDMTVPEAEEWAHNHLTETAQKKANKAAAAKAAKASIVNRYALHGFIYGPDGVSEVSEADCIPAEVEALKPFVFAPVKLGESTMYLGYDESTCSMARYTLSPVERKPEAKPMSKAAADMSVEELMELLKAKQAEAAKAAEA